MYNLLIYLIVTEIRDGVGIRRGSVIGDFPLPLIILSNKSELFISNSILKLNDLVMFKNIILILNC